MCSGMSRGLGKAAGDSRIMKFYFVEVRDVLGLPAWMSHVIDRADDNFFSLSTAYPISRRGVIRPDDS